MNELRYTGIVCGCRGDHVSRLCCICNADLCSFYGDISDSGNHADSQVSEVLLCLIANVHFFTFIDPLCKYMQGRGIWVLNIRSMYIL